MKDCRICHNPRLHSNGPSERLHLIEVSPGDTGGACVRGPFGVPRMRFACISIALILVPSIGFQAAPPRNVDWKPYFPCRVGNRWVYRTNLGTELVREVVERHSRDDGSFRWRIETRGLRPDPAWPGTFWEEISLKKEGVGIHKTGTGVRTGNAGKRSLSPSTAPEPFWSRASGTRKEAFLGEKFTRSL